MIRVVVVDDEMLVRTGFQLILNLAPDIEVVATADGPKALDVIAVHHPDVVLLDIRMPGTDGLTILHELRVTPDRGPGRSRAIGNLNAVCQAAAGSAGVGSW